MFVSFNPKQFRKKKFVCYGRLQVNRSVYPTSAPARRHESFAKREPTLCLVDDSTSFFVPLFHFYIASTSPEKTNYERNPFNSKFVKKTDTFVENYRTVPGTPSVAKVRIAEHADSRYKPTPGTMKTLKLK